MALGDVKVGRLHEFWVIPFVFALVFVLNTVTFTAEPSAYMPSLNYGEIALSGVNLPTPSPIAQPMTSPAPRAVAATDNRSAVLGASTHPVPRMAVGIAADLPSMSTPQLDAALADMRSMGVRWVRYDMNWANIEYAGQGQYDWSNYDRVVSTVASYGLNTLAILDYTPSWARDSACSDTQMCEPANASDYAQFAAAAVARYRPYGVRTWEIWNEPNINAFFQPAADASEYTSLLQAAYPAIKAVDPGATVLTAGLAPSGTGGGNISPPDFLNGIYASGGRGYFDAVGDHPYTWPYLPTYSMPGNAWSQLYDLRNIMVSNGDGGKKIWITEFGAPTGGPGGLASSGMTTSEGGDDHVTEGLQSQMVTDSIQAASSLPWVNSFFWYSYQDDGTSTDTVENFFGLIRADGSLKPAYYAFKNVVGQY